MDITGALTEKIGPLPGYAYVAIGVGGVLWYRKNHGSPKARVLPSNDGATNLGISPTPVDTTGAAYSTPVDNNAWALEAAQHLGTTSAFSPGDISTALYNYLSGSGLSSAQQNIVNAAIGANGYPSGGLIPVVSADVPTPTLAYAAPTPQNMPYIAPPTPTYTPPAYIPPAYIPPDPAYTPQIQVMPTQTPAVRAPSARVADSWTPTPVVSPPPVPNAPAFAGVSASGLANLNAMSDRRGG